MDRKQSLYSSNSKKAVTDAIYKDNSISNKETLAVIDSLVKRKKVNLTKGIRTAIVYSLPTQTKTK